MYGIGRLRYRRTSPADRHARNYLVCVGTMSSLTLFVLAKVVIALIKQKTAQSVAPPLATTVGRKAM